MKVKFYFVRSAKTSGQMYLEVFVRKKQTVTFYKFEHNVFYMVGYLNTIVIWLSYTICSKKFADVQVRIRNP